VIIGGGDRPVSVTQRFIELAGGPAAACIVVIGLASEDPTNSARHSIEEFKKYGVAQIQALPVSRDQALQAIRQATGVYFGGGEQQKLVTALERLQLVPALHELFRRGGVLGGTSAGAAVMSEKMITGEERGIPTEEERFRSIQRDQIETSRGLGFITNAIIDQHFITRKRLNRLFSVVLENPKLLGIGIDESTAIIVGPDQKFEVVGERNVMVIDAWHAGEVRTNPDRRLSATDLRVHILTAGDRFDLRRGRPQRRNRPRSRSPETHR
jgi:cyanophycinase